jgi:hypothetical protein
MNIPVNTDLAASVAVHKPASELSPGSELDDKIKPSDDKRSWLM